MIAVKAKRYDVYVARDDGGYIEKQFQTLEPAKKFARSIAEKLVLTNQAINVGVWTNPETEEDAYQGTGRLLFFYHTPEGDSSQIVEYKEL